MIKKIVMLSFMLLVVNVSLFSQDTLTTLQKQLDYAQNVKRVKTGRSIDDISLVGYTRKGRLYTKADIALVIEKLHAGRSHIVMYRNLENFDIVPLRKIRWSLNVSDTDAYNVFINQLWLKITMDRKLGFETLELEWDFKGEKFYSTAIASNDLGIIYDPIGFLILDPDNYGPGEDLSAEEASINGGTSSDKSRSTESGTIAKDFHVVILRENFYGIKVIDLEIKCTSLFKDNILSDRKLSVKSRSIQPFHGKANLKTLNGVINTSNYHEFEWSYKYGSFEKNSRSIRSSVMHSM